MVEKHESLEEKTIQKKEIFKGKIVELSVHDVTLPNGKESKREIINHPGAVAVIAKNEEGKLLLVKQYRKPLEKTIAEIPAGKLEEGEDPADCVARELEEETGYTPTTLTKIRSFYTSPGFADEIVHLYLAEGLKQGKSGTDEDEFVEVIAVTLEEAEQMVETQEIHDAKTAFAVLYLRQQLLLEERS